jgi:hypothetical protein
MGKVVFTLVSKQTDNCYVQALATSPSFSAITSFHCPSKTLIEFGKRIKGFPKAFDEKLDYSIGAGKGKADFRFQTVESTGLCEAWVKIKGLEDEHGQSAEAYFPIDYLEPASIDAFSLDLIKMGTGNIKIAELKNRFEKEKK